MAFAVVVYFTGGLPIAIFNCHLNQIADQNKQALGVSEETQSDGEDEHRIFFICSFEHNGLLSVCFLESLVH